MRASAGVEFSFFFVCFGVLVAGFFAQGMAAQTPIGYVTVRDAREQAFSVEVPRGWKTIGGMFRNSTVDTRPLIDMTSSDGRSNVRLGDATIPPYTTPGPFNSGRRPGVAPYASGEQFAAKYGQARFGSMCEAVQVTGSRAMAPKYHSSGGVQVPGMQTTGGEAYLSCTQNGQPMFGYVYAETFSMGTMPGAALWYVVALGSFLCPVDQAKAVGEILKHSADSIRYNPVWSRMQQQLESQATQANMAQAQATIAATERMNAHQQAMIRGQDAQNENFNDILNGVSFTRDTATGKEYTVPAGKGGTQWINGNRAVVESAFSPGPGFNQLESISH